MFGTWKLFLVFSICIGISQSQYDYDGNDYYEDDFREREKFSFKTIPSKLYFQKGGDTNILPCHLGNDDQNAGDTIILPCHLGPVHKLGILENDDQNAGELYWILNNTVFDESETGSPYDQILTEGGSIMDYNLEDRNWNWIRKLT